MKQNNGHVFKKRRASGLIALLFGVSLFITVMLLLPFASFYYSFFLIVVLFTGETLAYILWNEKSGMLRLHSISTHNDMGSFLSRSILKMPNLDVYMYQGTLSNEFFDRPAVLEALKEGSTTRMIFGPKTFLNVPLFKLVKRGKVVLYRRDSEDEIDAKWQEYYRKGYFNHFITTSDRGCWLEYVHKPGTCEGGEELTGINALNVSSICEEKFLRTMGKCTAVDPENIIDSIRGENFVKGYDEDKGYLQLTPLEIADARKALNEEKVTKSSRVK